MIHLLLQFPCLCQSFSACFLIFPLELLNFITLGLFWCSLQHVNTQRKGQVAFAHHGFKHECLQHSIDFLIVIDVWGREHLGCSISQSVRVSITVLLWFGKKPECNIIKKDMHYISFNIAIYSVFSGIKYTSVMAEMMYFPCRKQEFKHPIREMSVHSGAIEIQWHGFKFQPVVGKRTPDLSSFCSGPGQTAGSLSEAAPGLSSLSNYCREKSYTENCITLHNYNTLCATICHPPKSLSDKCSLSLLQYNFNKKRVFS